MEQIPQAVYPGDIEAIDKLPPDRRTDFLKYMDDLDAEHVKRHSPYGDGSLWRLTGAECWIEFFTDGWSAYDALAEDLSYGYK